MKALYKVATTATDLHTRYEAARMMQYINKNQLRVHLKSRKQRDYAAEYKRRRENEHGL